MVAPTFEIGGSDYKEKIFDQILIESQEILIDFFGEEYRDIITQKIKNTAYVIAHRYVYDEDAEEKLKAIASEQSEEKDELKKQVEKQKKMEKIE